FFGEHAEEGALGIGAGEDDAGTKLGPIFEDHTSGAAVARVDACDRGGRANFNAEFLSGGSERLRYRAHSAHDVSVETLQRVIATAEQVKEKTDGGAWLVWAAVLAVHVVGQDHRLDGVGLVVAIEELTEAAGEERDQLRDFGRRNSAEPFTDAEQ